MGFQIPPTLPDYKKLQMILANSGVQSWNPPIFDILSRLIDAVGQSQDVITNTTIENIVNNAISNISTTNNGAPILNTTFTIPRARMNTLNTVPFVVLAATAGKQNVPLVLLTLTTQQRQFAANVQGTLQYTTIPGTPITAAITVVQGALVPGVIVNFFANGVAVSASFAATLTPVNDSIELKGSADSADGGAAGAPDVNQIIGTLFYIQN